MDTRLKKNDPWEIRKASVFYYSKPWLKSLFQMPSHKSFYIATPKNQIDNLIWFSARFQTSSVIFILLTQFTECFLGFWNGSLGYRTGYLQFLLARFFCSFFLLAFFKTQLEGWGSKKSFDTFLLKLRLWRSVLQ